MHSATQIIAQRAPPATRTKARWQPYYSISSASASSSSLPPRSPYLNTPNASVSSPLAPQPSSCDLRSGPSLSSTAAQTPKEPSQRDSTTKHKFAVGLIDQAVNTISEIWRPQDIPRVFQAPPKATTPLTTPQSTVLSAPKQQNIISRISPHLSSISSSTQPSHPSSSVPREVDQKVNTQAALLASGTDLDQNLLPIKTFIHEVLRRSRTSGSILQAALCYLEAIRPKIPEILREEKMGIRAHYLPDSTILPATPEELEREAELCAMEDPPEIPIFDDSMKTVRVTDCGGPEDFDAAMQQPDDGECSISSLLAEPSASSTSLTIPSLPSPLLCPRRAFLASLILASKFFQDKCYSNRAWAKLSGLPPREIGRCERALGQALGWRLWVGKNPVAPQPTAAGPGRTIIRSLSESCILSPSTSNQPFLNQNCQELTQDKQSTARNLRSGLRRCSTVPANVFVASATSSCETTVFTAATSNQGQDQDQYMDNVFEDGNQEPPSVLSSSNSEKSTSPIPETPGLTYSPSSTECSSGGDRTIQMSTFEDNMFPSVTGSQLWPDSVDPRCGAIRTTSPVSQMKGGYQYDNTAFILGLARAHANDVVSVIESETGSCGAHYLWREDSRYIPLEAAGVH